MSASEKNAFMHSANVDHEALLHDIINNYIKYNEY